MPDMSSEQFETVKARLRRILRRCGWTIHLSHRKDRWYARAAKRDVTGKQHYKYLATLPKIADMDTNEIVAILPPVA